MDANTQNNESYIKFSDLFSIFSAIAVRLNDIDKAIKNCFTVPENLKADNKIYAFVNGQLVEIAAANEVVLVDNEDTPMSLSLAALSNEKLPIIEDKKMLRQVKVLLGEEIFNKLAANSVATLELPMSDEQRLEKAKAEFLKKYMASEIDINDPDVQQSKTV